PRLLAGGAAETENPQRPVGRGAERGGDADRVDLLSLLLEQLARGGIGGGCLVALGRRGGGTPEHALEQGANGASGFAVRVVNHDCLSCVRMTAPCQGDCGSARTGFSLPSPYTGGGN